MAKGIKCEELPAIPNPDDTPASYRIEPGRSFGYWAIANQGWASGRREAWRLTLAGADRKGRAMAHRLERGRIARLEKQKRIDAADLGMI